MVTAKTAKSPFFCGREFIFFGEGLSLLFGERLHVSPPTGAEVDMPSPEASQDGLRIIVVLGAKFTFITIGCGHLRPPLTVPIVGRGMVPEQPQPRNRR